MDKLIVIYSPIGTGGVRRVAESIESGLNSYGVKTKILYGIKNALKFVLDSRRQNIYYIASLEGGVFLPFFKNSIFILHGFPSLRHYKFFGFLKLAIATKLFSRLASKTVAVSHFTKVLNKVMLGINSDRVIYNSLPHSIAQSSDIREPSPCMRILYVGRLVREKGVFEILDAFKSLNKIIVNSKLTFVGDGEEMSKLKILASCLPVDFLGNVDNDRDLSSIYSRHDIFISLNDSEPFGIVFLEAISFGLKIVCPHTGGQIEFIPNGYPHIRIESCSDIENISNSLLLANELNFPSGRIEKKHFSDKNMAQKYMEVINSI